MVTVPGTSGQLTRNGALVEARTIGSNSDPFDPKANQINEAYFLGCEKFHLLLIFNARALLAARAIVAMRNLHIREKAGLTFLLPKLT